jgi:hypothetical protein
VNPDVNQAVVDEVAEQDPDDDQRQAYLGCQVSHGDGRLAQLQELAAFRAEGQRIGLPARPANDIDEVEAQFDPWPGPAPRERVGTGDWPGVPFGPSIV